MTDPAARGSVPNLTNPANTPHTPQSLWVFHNGTALVTRTAALAATTAKHPVLVEPGGAYPFQDDIDNGRVFLKPPARASCLLSFYGTGDADKEALVNLWGWIPAMEYVTLKDAGAVWWEPHLLAQVSPILGTRVGLATVAGGTTPPLNNLTHKFADDFTFVADYTLSPGLRKIACGANSIGMCIFDFVGAGVLEVEMTNLDRSGLATDATTGIGVRSRTI